MLPIYESVRIGSVTTRDGVPFSMHEGLGRDLVEQLKVYSVDDTDTDLQDNTSDRKRFGEGSYEEWYSKERVPYALVASDGTLAALAWFGPKPLGRKSLKYLSAEELAKESAQEKSDWHTIVYRSYKPYRGAGLMTQFLHSATDHYLKKHPNAKLWAGINMANKASIVLAAKLGFKEVPELVDTEKNWLAMVRE